MKSKTGKGISAMRMVQKDGTEEGVFANEEEAEERVLANEEYITAWLDKVPKGGVGLWAYITAWLDKGAKRRCWPMRRGNLQGDALAPAARPRVRRQRARVHPNANEGRVYVHLNVDDSRVYVRLNADEGRGLRRAHNCGRACIGRTAVMRLADCFGCARPLCEA